MSLKTLNHFLALRKLLIEGKKSWWRFRKVEIDPSATVSLSSRFVPGGAGSIRVGAETLIAFKTLIIAHDRATGRSAPVRIGRRCFIGGGVVILPGVTIGDECVIGAGAIVASDIPARTVAGGNPAKVLRENIAVGRFGRMEGADDNSRRLYKI